MIRYSIIIWTIFVFCFFPTLESIGGIVFCFGTDGHVAIELAQAGICKDMLPGDMKAIPYVSQINKDHSTKTHCGPCDDVRISSNIMSRQLSHLLSKLHQQENNSPQAFTFATLTPPATEITYNSILPPAANPSFISLQSVILLM